VANDDKKPSKIRFTINPDAGQKFHLVGLAANDEILWNSENIENEADIINNASALVCNLASATIDKTTDVVKYQGRNGKNVVHTEKLNSDAAKDKNHKATVKLGKSFWRLVVNDLVKA